MGQIREISEFPCFLLLQSLKVTIIPIFPDFIFGFTSFGVFYVKKNLKTPDDEILPIKCGNFAVIVTFIQYKNVTNSLNYSSSTFCSTV